MNFWKAIKTFLGVAKELAPVAADVAKIAGADSKTLADIEKASKAAQVADTAINKE